MAAVEVVAVRKSFGPVPVLQDISLDVQDGEFMTLVGPSGCGKSTLLRVIAGLETPDAGAIRVAGREVTAVDPTTRNIAMVFQSYALYPHKTAFENIAFPLRMRAGWPTRLPLLGRVLRRPAEPALEGRVHGVAAQLGLDRALLGRKPGQLSGGQRQRVALARAMVREPVAFLMDEPLSNLDAKLRVDLRAEIVELQRRLGATVVYVTHDQGEAMTMSHRVAVMDGGRIRQIGAPLELYENPVDQFVAEFIGSPKINIVPATRQPDGALRAFGASFACPPGPVFAALKPGPLRLALRPEALTLADRPGGAPFAGTVRLVEHLGSEALVIVGMAGSTERLTVRVPAGEARALAPGAAVALRPDWSRALVFDERGRRMAAAPSRSAAA